MLTNFIKRLLVASFTLAGMAAQAEDIDLFLGASQGATDPPNVLFVIDTAASFSASVTDRRCNISSAGVVKTDGTGLAADFTGLDKTAGAIEQCALYAVVAGVDVSGSPKMNIGVMMFNANGMKAYNSATGAYTSDCVGSTGGCLMLPMVAVTAANKSNILTWIRNWSVSGSGDTNIKVNNLASGAVMQESWAYFMGKTGVSGRTYTAPNLGCGSKNVVFIGNAYRNNTTPADSTNEANSPLKPLAGTSLVLTKRADPVATADQISTARFVVTESTPQCGAATLTGNETRGVYALNWANYMRSQGITTFSIGVLGPTCNAEYAAHLKVMGRTDVGGGQFFGVASYQDLLDALNFILGQIQSVNSVFAAVSLPVSVNTQGTFLNQVYIGMFRPDQQTKPRWNGNLKQFKFGLTNGELKLQDASGTSAINSLTGFITECARSYWTPSAVDTYWSSSPSGGCLVVADSKSSDYPDGNVVEKGAQSYKLRNALPTARNMKTCSPVFASCTSMTDFATTNAAITQTLLNSGGSDRDTLINWARGTNLENELAKGTTVTRPSVHGDVVHSRPVPVNHGTDVARKIVVYYGGNDGMLRAVNGNRSGTTTFGATAYAAGAELWSFMPPEFYSSVKRMYDNTPTIAFFGSTITGAQSKPYGFDGPITAFSGTVGGVAKTYIYATMRRGGRAIYAFDVTTPDSPALLWKKGCPNAANDTDCSTDYSGLGQSWSSIKSMYAAGYDAGNSPLLIFGGGYDTCEDYDSAGLNHNCSSPKGNKIFVVDATTGAVVRAFDTLRSVPADIAVGRDSDGKANYAYTADTGGNVYRIKFGAGAPATWEMKRIAALGCDTLTCPSTVPNRKFMFNPSVVTADNTYYYVLLGSGDREKPLSGFTATTAMQNYFFMIKDKPGAVDNTEWPGTAVQTACTDYVICKAALQPITDDTTPSESDLAAKKGWYLQMSSTEQVVTSAITVFGVTTFSTHQPAAPVVGPSLTCGSNLGTTRVYNIDYTNASSANGSDERFEDVSGDGLPPSPVAGLVTLDSDNNSEGGGETVPFCIGCTGASSLESELKVAPGNVKQPRGRLYWYLQK